MTERHKAAQRVRKLDDNWLAKNLKLELKTKIIADIRTLADAADETKHYPELLAAAKQAFGALVGSSAASHSVQGQARDRLREALKAVGEL